MSKKTCGGCQHFLKVTGRNEKFGICQIYDGRTDSGPCGECEGFKRIPYSLKKSSVIEEEQP